MTEQLTCGDHSCILDKPTGQGTNGGCRCIAAHMTVDQRMRVQKYIQREKKVRDELLEALEGLAASVWSDIEHYDAHEDWLNKARAALARAKGGEA